MHGWDKRKIVSAADCILKAVVINEKIVFTGEKQVIDKCQQKFYHNSGSWFMDVANFREIDNLLKEEGCRIKTVHLSDRLESMWIRNLRYQKLCARVNSRFAIWGFKKLELKISLYAYLEETTWEHLVVKDINTW